MLDVWVYDCVMGYVVYIHQHHHYILSGNWEDDPYLL